MTKRVLILGITGQDGSYLAEQLLEQGCEVHGMVRHTSGNNLFRLQSLSSYNKLILHSGDMLDAVSVERLVREIRPHDLYNEADQDNVDFSFRTPSFSAQITFGAVVNLLEAIKHHAPQTRLFQPISATVFGPNAAPQTEQTPLAPQSPYACAKAATWLTCQHYRREYGLHIVGGVLYNHDSPRRSGQYLLHRIAKQVVLFTRGLISSIVVPPLEILVDIGHAREFMRNAILAMGVEEPRDYVMATGFPFSIHSLVSILLREAGFPDTVIEKCVQVHNSMTRPGSPACLVGDTTLAQTTFGFNVETDALCMSRILYNHYRNLPSKECM